MCVENETKMIYLNLLKWQFNICNPGTRFEFSREHRMQRWYVSLLDIKTDLMITKNLNDTDIEGTAKCLFSQFLDEDFKKLNEHIRNLNGKVEEISEGTETEADGPLDE